jgi:hypothetical protein
MNTTIQKYALRHGVTEIIAPVGIKPLCVKLQDGIPTMWAEINVNEPAAGRYRVRSVGTGSFVGTTDGDYIDTVLMANDTEVWHFYGSF